MVISDVKLVRHLPSVQRVTRQIYAFASNSVLKLSTSQLLNYKFPANCHHTLFNSMVISDVKLVRHPPSVQRVTQPDSQKWPKAKSQNNYLFCQFKHLYPHSTKAKSQMPKWQKNFSIQTSGNLPSPSSHKCLFYRVNVFFLVGFVLQSEKLLSAVWIITWLEKIHSLHFLSH